MRCAKCGAFVEPDDDYCPDCDAPLPKKGRGGQGAAFRCPECGAEWNPGDDSCPECGAEKPGQDESESESDW